jgi:hypothetical protein
MRHCDSPEAADLAEGTLPFFEADTLEFYDETGASTALLEAVYLR